jgi:hypothetical protein
MSKNFFFEFLKKDNLNLNLDKKIKINWTLKETHLLHHITVEGQTPIVFEIAFCFLSTSNSSQSDSRSL